MLKRLIVILLALCLTAPAWANDYYNSGAYPPKGSFGSSAAMRAELGLIGAGFDKLPTLTGNANKILQVNGSGTGITTTTGTITIPNSFAISGAYGLTLALSGTTNVTLPQSGTVATLAGAETLTNKTIASPTITGAMTVSGAGPHGIATSPSSDAILRVGGALGSSVEAKGLWATPQLSPSVNGNAYGVHIQTTFVEAASGTHPMMNGLYVQAPTATSGAANVQYATTLRIAGAPTFGDTNYSLWVDGGQARFGGGKVTIDTSATSPASVNPYLALNDGTTTAYFEMTGGHTRIYGLGHFDMAPGLSDKARVTSDGVLLVGSTDATTLSAGGIGMVGALRMAETSTPSAPASNNLVLYSQDDGSGNTVLAVRFPTGEPVTLARENVGIVPPGTVAFYYKSSAVAPSGWLLADGSAVSRTAYAALFSTIGTTAGAGDGSTTFNLPNLTNYATNTRAMIKCKQKSQAWTPTLVPRSPKSPKPWKVLDLNPALAQAA